MRFKDVYKRLNGREASAEQVLKFERLVSSLETTPNDAFLAVIVALDHYENLYSRIPEQINKSSANILADFKISANKTAEQAVIQAQAINAKALADIATKVASDVSTKKMYRWAFGSVAIAAISVSALSWYLHTSAFISGKAAGQAAGYEQAKSEIAAAAWANTAQGRQAYKFSQSGELDRLARCNGKGWVITKNVCNVYVVKDEGSYGWVMP